MRTSGALLAVMVGVASACGGSSLLPMEQVSLGGGVTATLSSGGALEIAKNGQRLLGTARGKPLFSRAIDVDDPDGFHNPRKLDDVTFAPVSDAAIEIDSPAPGVLHLSFTADDAPTVLASLALEADDGFYGGLGERFEHAGARGQIVGMQLEIDGTFESGTTDRHVPVPWLVSSKGYAVFVKSRESGAFDVAATDADVVRATFEGKAMDVTIVVNDDPLSCVATLAQMTGLPRRTPATVLGPMMWRHVDDEAQLFSDLARIRSLHIPVSTFWIDDGWQTSLNSHVFDPATYPDIAALAPKANALGFQMWGWNSPYLEKAKNPPADEAQELWTQADANGWLVKIADGESFIAPGLDANLGFGMIDFANPAARAFWAGRVKQAVDVGIHGFKLDYGEDGVPDLLNARIGLRYGDGSTDRTAREYPLGYHGAYRDALAGVDDGVLIVRASTWGGAQVADVIWPGDLDNGFQHRGDRGDKGNALVGGLPASIIAGQTLSASGFPLYGADVAGYRGDMPTKESVLRWGEASALSMVMQLGPGEKKYPWSYDDETVAIYKQLSELHQKLVPYLASVLLEAQQTGRPTLRSLPFVFNKDPGCVTAADDEYMIGAALLAAPVVTQGATSRSVHVPPGTWFSWWDGSRVDGPTDLTVQAPLGKPPLFVRAGHIVAELPDGIDTLFPSSDPSTVGIDAAKNEAEAIVWISGTNTTKTWDGGEIDVFDRPSGVEIGWKPNVTQSLTMTIDLSARTGASGALTRVVDGSGAALAVAASEDAVRSSTATTYFLAGNKLILRLIGSSDVTVQ